MWLLKSGWGSTANGGRPSLDLWLISQQPAARRGRPSRSHPHHARPRVRCLASAFTLPQGSVPACHQTAGLRWRAPVPVCDGVFRSPWPPRFCPRRLGSDPTYHQTAGPVAHRESPRRSPAPPTPLATASSLQAVPAPLRFPSKFPDGCSRFNPKTPRGSHRTQASSVAGV